MACSLIIHNNTFAYVRVQIYYASYYSCNLQPGVAATKLILYQSLTNSNITSWLQEQKGKIRATLNYNNYNYYSQVLIIELYQSTRNVSRLLTLSRMQLSSSRLHQFVLCGSTRLANGSAFLSPWMFINKSSVF